MCMPSVCRCYSQNAGGMPAANWRACHLAVLCVVLCMHIQSDISSLMNSSICMRLFLQGTVTDTAGKVNLAVAPLSFSRISYPLIAGTSYATIKSPGLLTLT